MRTLTREGFTVTGTTFGADAIRIAIEMQPDVTVMDMSMPEVDGFEILKVLHSEAPHLHVIAVSGSLQGVLLNSTRMFGATKVLEKPVDAELLVRTIREILGRGELRARAAGSGESA